MNESKSPKKSKRGGKNCLEAAIEIVTQQLEALKDEKKKYEEMEILKSKDDNKMHEEEEQGI